MRMRRIACGWVAGVVLLFSAWLATASPLIFVPLNATWSYLADGTDQGTLWRQPGFNDFAWPSGPAELGYGDGDEATVVLTPTNAPRPIAVYFRRNVVIPAALSAASLRLVRDDGAVVYVNGVEVLRSNMPDGPVGFDTLALLAVEPTNAIASPISTAPFVVGTNVIAVEVHQVNSLSSDLSFALELIAETGPVTNNTPPTVAIFQPTNGAAFTAPVNIELRATASDLEDGQPVNVEFFSGSNQIGAAMFFPTLCPANCPYYSLTWSNAPVGVHTLRARATDSAGASTFSAPIQITVSSQPGGTNSFPVVRVFATDGSASENNPMFSTGRFTFTRTGPISNSLPVFFALSGTASHGFDYFIGTNPVVVIPAGSSNAHLILTPIDDSEIELTESVTLTVVPPVAAFTQFYLVGSPSNATVFIQDNDGDTNNPPEHTVVHVVATDSQAAEGGTNANPGQFAIRRSGNLGSAIPVLFTISGTASNGGDYNFVSNSVMIPAGATQAVVNILPRNDLQVEGTETVVLTLRTPVCVAISPPPPECYVLGSPTQAVVTIADAQGGGTNNNPPVAFWLSPPNGSVVTQSMGILLQASAHDSDGSIVRVEFRNNGALIGLATSSAGTNYTFSGATLRWELTP